MRLTFFQKEQEVSSLGHLRQALQLRHKEKYAAFCLSNEQDMSLLLFIHNDDAWLYFFRFNGDSGAYSVNPDPSPDNETVGFIIDNFQLDEMPRDQVVSRRCGEEAVEEFFETQKLPNAICWHFVD